MAVAETGSIVLLENEGNIRMSVTVPRVQVVLMGIEKVIPTLEDMSLLIALLSRAATGQKLSNYVSILTGPRQDGELDGPEALHVVIMDNGRSRILADPDLRSCLHCIRCGSCFNVCPVYLTVGGHSYGWVYSGPIGSILTPQLVPARLARLLPFASTLCGACAEVCPVRIDLPKLLLTLRQRLTEDPNWDGGIPLQERVPMALYGRLLTRPRLYEAAWRAVRLLHPVLAPRGEWVALPPPLARWARSRWVPPLARPFSRGWQGLRRALGQGGDGA
jgi:L-lactate dehydrogenase complex protein LldF